MSDPAVLAPVVAAASCALMIAAVAVLVNGSCPTRGAAGPTTLPRDEASLTRRASRSRLRAVHAETPQLLDLLAAGSTAGLSAELSFRQAVNSLRGPLGEDLRAMIDTVDLGKPWRTALAEHAETTGDGDLRRAVSVLARTETLGVPLSEATADLAASVREARRAVTLERARTAPVKMLFPLVFLILPAFLLLTVVPVLITTIRSID